ncbi:MAG: PAS domain-containing protein [Planctomycetes bacterium]|nr:PAS domain-containing protein [Planctomycetota bacterium]
MSAASGRTRFGASGVVFAVAVLLGLLAAVGGLLYSTGRRLLVDVERTERHAEVEAAAASLAEPIELAERLVRTLAEADALERLTRDGVSSADASAHYRQLDAILSELTREEAVLRLEVLSLGFDPPLCGFSREPGDPALDLLEPPGKSSAFQAKASAGSPRQLLVSLVGKVDAPRVAAAWRTGRGWLVYAEVDARRPLERCAQQGGGGTWALASQGAVRWPRGASAPFDREGGQAGTRVLAGEILSQALVTRAGGGWQLLVRVPQSSGFSLETRLTLSAAAMMALVVIGLGIYALRVTNLQTSLDQSERQETELQGTFDAITDPLLVLDRELKVVRTNRVAAEDHGRAARGDDYAQVLVRRGLVDPGAFLEETSQVVSGGLPRHTELVLADPAGERVLLVAQYPVFAADLTVSGVVEHARDVTQTRRLQSQLVQSEKLSTLGEMAAGIAHEVNNPIAVISMFAQLLREELDDLDGGSGALEKVELIEEQAASVGEIVKGLLRFARKSEGVKVRFDARGVPERALALLSHQKLLRDVTLIKEPDASFGALVKVLGDEGQLAQVVLNLIVNACHAMEGKGELTIGVSRGTLSEPPAGIAFGTPDETPARVRLSVGDTGAGIEPAALERIFEPFFTTKPTGEGTGLGLSVGFAIIREHGGCIFVETAPGEGTTFVLDLPDGAAPLADSPSEGETDAQAPSSSEGAAEKGDA